MINCDESFFEFYEDYSFQETVVEVNQPAKPLWCHVRSKSSTDNLITVYYHLRNMLSLCVGLPLTVLRKQFLSRAIKQSRDGILLFSSISFMNWMSAYAFCLLRCLRNSLYLIVACTVVVDIVRATVDVKGNVCSYVAWACSSMFCMTISSATTEIAELIAVP